MSKITVTEEAATPATPAAGKWSIYTKSDGLYIVDDAGVATGPFGSGGGGGDKYPMEARLTLETGVAISATDQTAKTTLYLTKYKGDQIAIYSGTAWSSIALTSDLSITLAGLTASLPFDVFVYSNAGTLTLELLAWTNTTTRATALTTQNGILVKNGDTTRRYVGTICITGTTGQCEDSKARRLVWNYYNRTSRLVEKYETTDSWNYTTATWRAANNSTANRIEAVIGINEDVVEITVSVYTSQIAAWPRAVGVGLDTTSGNSASIKSKTAIAAANLCWSLYKALPGIGYHYFQWVEYAVALDTCTWYGDNAEPTFTQSGMIGTIET